MENQESKSNWDDLARTLGADLVPDQPAPSPPETPQQSYSRQREADKPRPAPPKRTADWSQLNVDLGLPPVDVPPTPEPARAATPAPEPAPPVAREQRSRDDRQHERRSHDDRPRQDRPRQDRDQASRGDRGRGRSQHQESSEGPPNRDEERGRGGRGRRGRRGRGGRGQGERDVQQGREQGEQPARAQTERGRRDRGQRSDRNDRGDRNERRHHDQDREKRTPEGRDSQPTFFEVEEFDTQIVSAEETIAEQIRTPSEPTPPPVAEAPKPSAGVSLWHKIFGSPSEQAAKITEQVEETERVEAAESIAESIPERESAWPELGEPRPASPFDDSASIDPEIDTGSQLGEPRESYDRGDESRGRGRTRRRRGRGGRGGRDGDRPISRRRQQHSAEHTDSHRAHDDDFDDLGVEQDDDAIDSPLSDDISGADDDLDGAIADDDRDGSAARGHRGIPSWDEAIGMIVDSNMQSRSQRPRPAQSGRRGGSSRGRSRGGRRHNGHQQDQ